MKTIPYFTCKKLLHLSEVFQEVKQEQYLQNASLHFVVKGDACYGGTFLSHFNVLQELVYLYFVLERMFACYPHH